MLEKIALGGGCHWCTEAVFQSLTGVVKVEQGFVASTHENGHFSEAVVVDFNRESLSLQTLIDIHLHTHNSTSNHSLRHKYRSAVYTFNALQHMEAATILEHSQKQFEQQLITKVLPYIAFKPSSEAFKNYYYRDPEKPFCKAYIEPKIKLLIQHYSKQIDLQILKQS